MCCHQCRSSGGRPTRSSTSSCRQHPPRQWSCHKARCTSHCLSQTQKSTCLHCKLVKPIRRHRSRGHTFVACATNVWPQGITYRCNTTTSTTIDKLGGHWVQLLQVPGWHHRLRQGCPMRALMCASAQSHRGGRPLPGRPRRRNLRRRRRPSVRTWHLARGLHYHQPLPCQVRVRFLAHHWLIHSFSTSYFSQGNTTQGIHKCPCMSTARSNVCASSAFCAAAGLLPLVNDTLSSLQQHAGSVTTNWPHLAELKQPNYVTVVKNRVNFGQRFCGVACRHTSSSCVCAARCEPRRRQRRRRQAGYSSPSEAPSTTCQRPGKR